MLRVFVRGWLWRRAGKSYVHGLELAIGRANRVLGVMITGESTL